MVKSSDAKQLRNWKVSSSTAFITPMPYVPQLTSSWYFSLLGAAEVWPAATWWRRRRASWGRPGTRSGTSRWGWRRRTTRTRYSPHHQADSRHLISHSQLNIFLFLSVHRHKYYIEKDLWSYIEQFSPRKDWTECWLLAPSVSRRGWPGVGLGLLPGLRVLGLVRDRQTDDRPQAEGGLGQLEEEIPGDRDGAVRGLMSGLGGKKVIFVLNELFIKFFVFFQS